MNKKCIKCGYIRQPTDTAHEYECPQCGVVYEKAERAIQENSQGAVAEVRKKSKAKPAVKALEVMEKNEDQRLEFSWQDEAEKRMSLPVPVFARNAGLLGVVLLFAGVFSPVLHLPIVGSLNYLGNGQGDGVIILVQVALSLMFIFKGKVQELFWTASASLAVILFTIGNILWKMHEMKISMEENLKNNPFRGLADMAGAAVQIEWGWGVLFAGSVSLFVAAFAHRNQIYSFNELTSASKSVDERLSGNFPIQSRKIERSYAPSNLVTIFIMVTIFVVLIYGGYSVYQVKLKKHEEKRTAAALIKLENETKAALEAFRIKQEASERDARIEAIRERAIEIEQQAANHNQRLLEEKRARDDAVLEISERRRNELSQANLIQQGIEDKESAWKKFYVKTPACLANYTGDCANVYMQKKIDFETYWGNRKR